MRFITPETALAFLSLGQTCVVPTDIIDIAVETYQQLIEVKHNIVSLSDIRQMEPRNDDDLSEFEIIEGRYYHEFYQAMQLELVWNTETNSVCLTESVKRWRHILSRGMVKKDFVDRIRENGLSATSFKNFETDLMLYLMNCEVDGDCYTPTRQVIELSMIGRDDD